MAKIVEVEDGKFVLISKGGYERYGPQHRILAQDQIEVAMPLEEIHRWGTLDKKSTGTGTKDYVLCADKTGKEILVFASSWNPAEEHNWKEDWEQATDDPGIIQNAKATMSS